MFLKSLKLQGFKSFATKVELDFPGGISCIVGPNGSGKSNIADAARWVLGEQSIKSLRGSKLEDVIFAGSEKRRSVGMAEVSMTLDNADGDIPLEYAEVTVTRRVYRSGESEFLINQVPCRLRDIQELFMDTGLGPESFSLIGQGEIDSILSARGEDRRTLIEETAGITKYRYRKREALRKLGETEEHLVRIYDIIGEVERQVGPLAQEAERARKYRTLREQLTLAEVDLYGGQWTRLRVNHEKAQAAEARIAQRLDKLVEAVERVRAESERLKQRVRESERELEQAAFFLESVKDKQSDLSHRYDVIDLKLEHLAAEKERLDEDEDRLDGRRAELQELVCEAEAVREDAIHAETARQDQLQVAEAAWKQANDRLRAAEDELERIQGSRLSLSEALSTARHQLELVQGHLENLDEKTNRTQTARARIEVELNALRTTQASQGSKLEAVRTDTKRADEQIESVRRGLATTDAEIGRLEQALSETRETFNLARSRRRALREMAEDYEGYSQGVRRVLRDRDQFGQGILGAVAELVKVPETLETAVEICLGGALQNIVTTTDADAEAAILHLKERRAGRATFLPLSSLRYHALSKEELLGYDGVVGVGSHLVQFDETVRPAIEYLLGRVVVAENLAAALVISKGLRSFGRIVTLDGELITPGGAITGGSMKRTSRGLLARRRELEQLNRSVRELEDRLNQMESERGSLVESRDEDNQRLVELQGQRQRLEVENASLQKELESLSERETRLESELTEIDTERAEVDAVRQQVLSQQAEATAQVAASQEGQEQLESAVNDAAGEIDDFRRQKDAAAEALANTRVSLVEAKNHRARADEKRGALQENLRYVEQERQEIEARRQELDRTRAEHRRDQETVRVDLKKCDLERAQVEERLETLGSARQGLQANLDKTEAALEEQRKEENQISEERHEVLRRLERLELAMSQAQQKLAEYDVVPIWTGSVPSQDDAGRSAEVERLRRRVRSMEPVNTGAIEEYAAVKERFEFLSGQRSDLESARSQLREAIVEIDRTSRQRFASTFEKLRSAFQTLFSRLFSGGKADLVTTDPEDPLESAVEIVVQPPGKRRQNLMALSGGERALAAIALLFAILQVNPSPFCLLDEIDAALDDTNLARFAGVLQDFSDAVQFVVITHRQGTMETASSLYGVTMEEFGVSQVVSLELPKAEPLSNSETA